MKKNKEDSLLNFLKDGGEVMSDINYYIGDNIIYFIKSFCSILKQKKKLRVVLIADKKFKSNSVIDLQSK